MTNLRRLGMVICVCAAVMACTLGSPPGAASPTAAPTQPAAKTPAPSGTQPANTSSGLHKIQHVIVIMQENRSFDTYFGTYPGADGIPMQNGVPTVCATDPQMGTCVEPYHDPEDVNTGGPHA